MPIWALTAERLDRLSQAIANKKSEHENLLAKSEKDLWCADLDEFTAEWNTQLALEAEIQTQIRRMGRRVSKKIGAGRNRKAKDDDDYAPEKKPRAKGKAAPKPKVETKSAQRFAEMFSSKPTKREATADVVDLSDNFSDDDFKALGRSKSLTANATEPSQQSQSQTAPQSQSEEAAAERPATKRAAASKAKALFDISSDSASDSDGGNDDLLGDIGDMVKGISKPTEDDGARVSLYAMNRPGSSHGGPGGSQKLKTKPSKAAMDIDSHDDTNYELLAKSTPHKTATRDEDDEALNSEDELVGSVAQAVASTLKSSGIVPVKKARAKPAAAKTKTKAEPSKGKASAGASRGITLSPAAKAYAARKKVQGVKASALVDSDDDLEDAPSPVPKAKPAARARPGRAAAAKRRVIVDDEEEDDSSGAQIEEDDPFEMDDD